ncbi:hypothetical protein SDC9_134562 [bioreactor metagenome]|uniref:Uncharacterized protein n=1 Tax=bioreactor metagenome TaxID=1076179 RepID=A0A645DDM9_9ZZZZ
MDGDVVRAQLQAGVQRPAEALRVVLRKTRDQIHVDVFESGGDRLLHGGENLRRRMAAADGLQNPVLHGLGIHGDPRDAVALQDPQLFPRHRVGTSGLDSILAATRKVK